jgi:transcriptional regulator of arginine metabolism
MTFESVLFAVTAEAQFADQSELQAALAARGFALTQSTLSRKLKALGFQKLGGHYVQAGELGIALLSAVCVAPNLLVLRTAPGFANALAVRLDAAPVPGQAGTIAGDDTVFVAVQPELLNAALRVAQRWLLA